MGLISDTLSKNPASVSFIERNGFLKLLCFIAVLALTVCADGKDKQGGKYDRHDDTNYEREYGVDTKPRVWKNPGRSGQYGTVQRNVFTLPSDTVSLKPSYIDLSHASSVRSKSPLETHFLSNEKKFNRPSKLGKVFRNNVKYSVPFTPSSGVHDFDRSTYVEPIFNKGKMRLLHDKKFQTLSRGRDRKYGSSKSRKERPYLAGERKLKTNSRERYATSWVWPKPNANKRLLVTPRKQKTRGESAPDPSLVPNRHISDYRFNLERSPFLPFPEETLASETQQPKMEARNSEFDVPSIHKVPKASHLRQKRPNIVLIITDDLDVELGSLNYMPRLLRLMGNGGALFSNAYTTTPMCCPSRSSLLTGMYIHNHQVFTNHQNCSSPLWQNTHERRSFASYLSKAGYKTGYFGKYLNRYNGSHVPAGWKEWAGLIMNSRYYNYTVNRNNQHVKYGDKYPHDYYPHVITNDGINFLRTNAGGDSESFLLVMSYPAPHGPEDSAPEHAHKFFNASDHHTASYNYAPNPDKQWILQFTNRMADIQLKYSDLLMTKRLQTLQTIDESVEKIVNTIEELGEANNTYLFFTSDHGYHLGQFGLAKGKSMPFEFDVKVPFLVRGPGIKQGVHLPQIALNIDLAPTFLDIAGLSRPPQMDGRSLLPVLQSSVAPEDAKSLLWRDTFLIESSGRLREEEAFEKKEQRTWERERALTMTLLKAVGGDTLNNSSELGNGHGRSLGQTLGVELYTSKHERLEEVCQRQEFGSPCKPTQKWYCVKIGIRWKIKKCRHKAAAVWQKHCICHFVQGFGTFRKLDVRERRRQRSFLKKYVTKGFKSVDSKFLKSFNNINIPLQFGDDALSGATPHSKREDRRRRNGRLRLRRSIVKEIQENGTEGFEFGFSFNNFTQQLMDLMNFDEGPTDVVPTDVVNEEGNLVVGLPFHEDIADSDSVHAFVEEEELRDIKDQIHDITDEIHSLESVSGTSFPAEASNATTSSASPKHGCEATEGFIDCEAEVYEDFNAWKSSKVAIEDQMRRLRQQLHVMKNILGHLQTKKPDLMDLYDNDDYDEADKIDYDNDDFGGDYDEIPTTLTDLDTTEVVSEDTHLGMDNKSLPESSQPSLESSMPSLKSAVSSLKSSVSSFDNGKEKIRHKPLTLPEVGLDIPLVEDVNFPVTKNRKRKYEKRKYLHKKPAHDLTTSGSNDGGGNTGKLYYPVSLPELEDGYIGNDSLQHRFCWCDRKMIQKLAVQAARERKRVERQKIKEKRYHRKLRRKRKKEKMLSCNYATLNCYTHDNDHWRIPPLWTDGPFCFCINSANNTYWCLRTINQTHNFLYCEFITGLITYYDLHIDPYQLRNVAFTLSNEKVFELNEKLTALRSCKGADVCDGWKRKEKSKPKNTENSKSGNSFVSGAADRHRLKSAVRKKKLQERQRRKRMRKERRKIKKALKTKDNLVALPEDPFSEMGQSTIRIPRKSRHGKEAKRQKRKERKRQRRKRKKEKRKIQRIKDGYKTKTEKTESMNDLNQ